MFWYLQFHNFITSTAAFFFQQVYDEIEICPLNVHHIHLTKTENITDFGKFNQNSSQEFFFLLFWFLLSLFRGFLPFLEPFLSKSVSAKDSWLYNEDSDYTGKFISYFSVWERPTVYSSVYDKLFKLGIFRSKMSFAKVNTINQTMVKVCLFFCINTGRHSINKFWQSFICRRCFCLKINIYLAQVYKYIYRYINIYYST